MSNENNETAEPTTAENEESGVQENAPDATISWDAIALDADIRSGVDGRGYTNPTAVQAQAIPSALEGL